MTVATLLFYLFSAVMLASGVMVISSRNPVHSVLFLILAFFNAAGLFILLGAEFLAIALVLVYVGAVMVLFLFVVMMLDVNFDSLRKNFRSYVPVGATVGLLVLIEMALVVIGSKAGADVPPAPPEGSNTRALGRLIYVDYVYAFEIAAVILLVAIIAAIALTHRTRKETKHQDPGRQVKVRAKDRIRLIDLPVEKKE